MPSLGSHGIKRKTQPSSSSLAKRVKTKHLLSEDLPWKTSAKPREADLGTGLDGFLELEEVDDVDIEYEETDAGRIARFKVRNNQINTTRIFLDSFCSTLDT